MKAGLMALTIEAIHNTADDKALFDLLSEELNRLIPPGIQKDPERYHELLPALPRGLRAMAGIHFFDVSMTLDDIAWHFGNQNNDRALQETLNGLRELELLEIADMFERMWDFFIPYMSILRSEDPNVLRGKDPHDWLEEIGAQELADPMNDFIWAHCQKAGKWGLLESWPIYARKFPERCVISEAQV